jgi:putative component of membrane protein insertase Oxa1/YidC/SpoIIIJ protein YidD
MITGDNARCRIIKLGGRMTRSIAAGAIGLYQRHLSPRKGYGCARRLLRGRMSCAEFARRAVLRVGIVRLVPLLLRRMSRCAAAGRRVASGENAAGRDESLPLDYADPRMPTSQAAGARERRWKWRRDGSGWYCGEPHLSDFVCSGATCCCPPWQ